MVCEVCEVCDSIYPLQKKEKSFSTEFYCPFLSISVLFCSWIIMDHHGSSWSVRSPETRDPRPSPSTSSPAPQPLTLGTSRHRDHSVGEFDHRGNFVAKTDPGDFIASDASDLKLLSRAVPHDF